MLLRWFRVSSDFFSSAANSTCSTRGFYRADRRPRLAQASRPQRRRKANRVSTWILPGGLIDFEPAGVAVPPSPFPVLFANMKRSLATVCATLAATASQVVAQPASFATFDARARAGGRLTVVFFGGSLTWSANATEPNRTGFRGLVADWFAETYPDAHFTFVDAAIGGTGSLLGIFRLDRDVLAKKPDLVFLDFSCNDGWNRESDLENLTAACAYESLLRRMTGAGVPVVQMFFTFREWIAGVLAGKDPDEVHRRRKPYLRLAEPYGTAVGDIYRDSSMLADLRAGKTSIDVLWPIDGGHPDDPGYRYFAEAGIAGYRRAVAEGIVGRVPETPLYGTAEELRRADAAALASAPHPAAWTPRLAYRTSLWYDGLSSRWMDGVLAFGGVERAPLSIRAKGNLFGIFGEADENALVAEIRADGKPVATFNGYHNAGKGRLFIWRHAALPGWEKGESVERAFEIDPAPNAETAGEFRIGSVCTATLLPSQSGIAYFSGVSDSSAAAGDDVEKIDHARGK